MIARPLTPRDRAQARRWTDQIPGSDREGFWRRVASGFYLLIGLYDRDDELRGVLVTSANEGEAGKDLWVQLATDPGFASEARKPLTDLLRVLAVRYGAKRISFESKRVGWAGVARSLGFTEQAVRYTMEV